jgi:hypothetical protein
MKPSAPEYYDPEVSTAVELIRLKDAAQHFHDRAKFHAAMIVGIRDVFGSHASLRTHQVCHMLYASEYQKIIEMIYSPDV